MIKKAHPSRDINQIAKHIMELSTGQTEDKKQLTTMKGGGIIKKKRKPKK